MTKIKQNQKQQCAHDFSKSNSTVKILENFRTMVVPDVRYGVCVCCGKKFKISNIQNLQGKGDALKDDDIGGDESETK